MMTQEIINEIGKINIYNSENLDRIQELTDLLRINGDGYLACKSLINLMERHPQIEFGTPGEPVHTLETFIGHYEQFLYESINRKPTCMTIWMLNRIINSKIGIEKEELMDIMKNSLNNENADENVKEQAQEFINFQKA